MVTEKECKMCGDMLRIDLYHKAPKNKDGRDTHCKYCRAEKKAAYAKSGMRRANAYRLGSVDKLNSMLAEGCNICGSFEKLCIDHDHSCCDSRNISCGQCVRGVLCDKCNRGIGYLQDDVEILLKAIEYLTRAKG